MLLTEKECAHTWNIKLRQSLSCTESLEEIWQYNNLPTIEVYSAF